MTFYLHLYWIYLVTDRQRRREGKTPAMGRDTPQMLGWGEDLAISAALPRGLHRQEVGSAAGAAHPPGRPLWDWGVLSRIGGRRSGADRIAGGCSMTSAGEFSLSLPKSDACSAVVAAGDRISSSQESAALGPEQDGPLDIQKPPAFRRRPRDREFCEEGTEGAGDEGPKSSIPGCESSPRPSVPGGSEEQKLLGHGSKRLADVGREASRAQPGRPSTCRAAGGADRQTVARAGEEQAGPASRPRCKVDLGGLRS